MLSLILFDGCLNELITERLAFIAEPDGIKYNP